MTTMNETRLPNWLLPLAAACALLAAGSIYYRIRVEARNRATEITVEMETVENLASSQGVPLNRALASLKQSGLGSVVLSELTVADLLNSHQANMTATSESVAFTFPDRSPLSSSLRRKLAKAIRQRFPLVKLAPETGAAAPYSLTLSGDLPNVFALRQTSIGLAADELAEANAADLRIIGRFGNPVGATETYVTSVLTQAKVDGAYAFLPQGEQVLGRRDGLKHMEDELVGNDLYYCTPEFAKIGGDANVVDDIPERVIRLHSAQSAELDKLPYAAAVDRYAKASRERNQRILLLRPVSNSAEKPLDEFRQFIVDVGKGIRADGNSVGAAKPFAEPETPRLVFLLLGLAMIGPVWYGLARFIALASWRWALLGLIVLCGVACWSPHFRMPMAFLGALAFPMLGFFWLDDNPRTPVPVSYLVVTVISMIGGMCVAGLLNGLPYFIQAQQFQGVKVAVFLPIVAIGIHYMNRLGDIREVLRDPITYRQALLGLVILAVLGFMISRTGNDNPAGVSGTELKMRDVLDKILFVRPRTKEFMFGHPFLVVGLCLLAWDRDRRKRATEEPGMEVHWTAHEAEVTETTHVSARNPIAGWTALALMLGAVGQTDVVNTLCHLHSPIMLAFARIGVGWVAGGILGWVLWAVVSKLLKNYGEQLG
ncbi:MAG: hypothetical protein JSS65_10020 [Armatimonadetes bacterium]|nr:hypothetical protein [Armatimonadota bacterium]